MPSLDLGVDRSESMEEDACVGAQYEWAATDKLVELDETLENCEVFFFHGGPSSLARVESAASDVEEAKVFIKDGVDGAFALTEYGSPVTVGGDEAVAGGAA